MNVVHHLVERYNVDFSVPNRRKFHFEINKKTNRTLKKRKNVNSLIFNLCDLNFELALLMCSLPKH